MVDLIFKRGSRVFFFFLLIGAIIADDGLPNLSVRPELQTNTVDLFAKMLYWYTSETVDWAYTQSYPPNSVQTTYQTFVFNWAPGFSAGLGYNMGHDQWDTRASYTWFQSKATGQASGSVTSAFLAARLSFLEPYSMGKVRLDLQYNMFDWDLGRTFSVSKSLSLRPDIGLKGGWINQMIHSSWATPHLLNLFFFSAIENVKQRFYGAGPKGGAEGKWYFGNPQKHSLSLIGKFEASYLWGHWSIRDRFIDDLATVITVNTSDRNFGSLVLYSFMGFGWDCNLNENRSHIGLTLGYEIEDWLNQFQAFTNASGSQNNDLILQGLHFGLNVDF